MKLNKQQKACGMLLLLASVALLIDRTLLGPSEAMAQDAIAQSDDSGAALTPQTADASAAGDLNKAIYDERVADDPVPWPQVAAAEWAKGGGLARRMKTVAASHNIDSASLTDAFWPAWVSANVNEPADANLDLPDPAAFAEGHQLSGLLGSGPSGYAVVNGKCIGLGSTVDGFTLVKLGERSALFQAGDVQVELKVPGSR